MPRRNPLRKPNPRSRTSSSPNPCRIQIIRSSEAERVDTEGEFPARESYPCGAESANPHGPNQPSVEVQSPQTRREPNKFKITPLRPQRITALRAVPKSHDPHQANPHCQEAKKIFTGAKLYTRSKIRRSQNLRGPNPCYQEAKQITNEAELTTAMSADAIHAMMANHDRPPWRGRDD